MAKHNLRDIDAELSSLRRCTHGVDRHMAEMEGYRWLFINQYLEFVSGLTYNSKKSPASIGGGMNCYSLHKSFFSGGGKDGK